MSEVKKAQSMLTKKRYNDLKNILTDIYGSDNILEEALAKFCDIMRFDPDASTYNKEKKEQITRSIKKRAEELGVSMYVTGGSKASYQKKRGITTECKSEMCDAHGYEVYDGYCARCFVHLFPDKPVSRRIKTKESSVIRFIKEQLPDYSWVFDKKVDEGCSRYRPDIFLDCLTHSLIIEVDENQHETYDCTCENKRLMTLFRDLGSRPLVMIRFNPDGYETRSGKHIKSCFVYKNKNGLPSVRNEEKWKSRLGVLKAAITRNINDVPCEEVRVEHLYYDGF